MRDGDVRYNLHHDRDPKDPTFFGDIAESSHWFLRGYLPEKIMDKLEWSVSFFPSSPLQIIHPV